MTLRSFFTPAASFLPSLAATVFGFEGDLFRIAFLLNRGPLGLLQFFLLGCGCVGIVRGLMPRAMGLFGIAALLNNQI